MIRKELGAGALTIGLMGVLAACANDAAEPLADPPRVDVGRTTPSDLGGDRHDGDGDRHDDDRHDGSLPNDRRFSNPSGYAATHSTTGSVDLTGPFFQSLGTNGRSCGTCHLPTDGWTIIPENVRERFERT
ncbi:MAG: hypothetical protein JWO86_2280, partial [Myxococcaceae bacterium]|nr:hypothetical protein [Myxococcaceae bacterium]